ARARTRGPSASRGGATPRGTSSPAPPSTPTPRWRRTSPSLRNPANGTGTGTSSPPRSPVATAPTCSRWTSRTSPSPRAEASTWTWDDLVDIATRLTDATDEGTYGVQQFGTAGGPPLFVFLRQLGAERFSAEGGLGYAAEDLQQWMELVLRLQETGAAPSASEAVEDAARSLDQSLFAVGRCGMQAQWSNQAVTFDSSLGGTVEILRMPSMSGSAADAELWYKASMYFAVAAGSPNAEAAAAF